MGVLRPDLEAGRSLQVLSIGDRQADLDAGHLLSALLTKDVSHAPRGRWPVKTVRMTSEPAAQTLSMELQSLAALLPSLCDDQDRALVFNDEGLVEAFATKVETLD